MPFVELLENMEGISTVGLLGALGELNTIESYFVDNPTDSFLGKITKSTSLAEIFQGLFSQWDLRCDVKYPHNVRQVVSALLVSRRGLSEAELMGILKSSRAALTPVLLALEPCTMLFGGLLNFRNGIVRENLLTWYYGGDGNSPVAIASRQKIVEYFETNGSPIRKAEELPWQLIMLQDFRYAYVCIVQSLRRI